MAEESKLRKWAAEAAHQARTEKDANEARRLWSFAQYWTRLADEEDFRRDDRAGISPRRARRCRTSRYRVRPIGEFGFFKRLRSEADRLHSAMADRQRMQV